mgnify:CR=1 FL=1
MKNGDRIHVNAAHATVTASRTRKRAPSAGWLNSGATHIIATIRTLPSSAERTGWRASSTVTAHPARRSSP